mmetsp:Transcript_10685/g.29691  ORF Transcript_10685/g.29691 Transcript_10685/m.29691 type:complete len:334 (-) Transcript_10685:192-1193(-)
MNTEPTTQVQTLSPWSCFWTAWNRVTKESEHDPCVVMLLLLLFFFALAVVEPRRALVQLSVVTALWTALAGVTEQAVGLCLPIVFEAVGTVPGTLTAIALEMASHLWFIGLLFVTPPFLCVGLANEHCGGLQNSLEEVKRSAVLLFGRPCNLQVAIAASAVICSVGLWLDRVRVSVKPERYAQRAPAAGLMVVLAIIVRLTLVAVRVGEPHESQENREWDWEQALLHEIQETPTVPALPSTCGESGQSGDCVICFERDATVVFTQCAHLAYCAECHVRMAENAERSRIASREGRALDDGQIAWRWARCPICQQESRTDRLDNFSGRVYRQQLH